MSLMSWFNKPKWKSKDADIRAKAVHTDNTPELKSQLIHICQNDESEKVRSVAVKRLSDYSIIANIAQNDPHKSVKNAAYKMLQDWFTQTTDAQQLKIIKEIDDPKTIESAAQQAKDKEIRKYCIDKVKKQGLLGDLLVNEKDKDLRQLIVSKIDKPATLKRIAKLIKNKDKKTYKTIQAKLESDVDSSIVINQKALELCEQMEKLIHNANSSTKKDVEMIDQKWQELNNAHNLEAYQQRYNGAFRTANLTFDPEQRNEFLVQQRQQRIDSKIVELQDSLNNSEHATWEEIQSQISKYSGFDLNHANNEQITSFNEQLNALKSLRDQKSKEQNIPDELLNVVDKLDAILKQKYQHPNHITDIRKMWDKQSKKANNNAAFNTLKIRFDKAMLSLTEKVEKSANLRDEAAQKAVNDIEKVRKLIKDGQLADAKIGINTIAKNKKIAGHHKLIKKNKFEFDALWNELKELRQWQKWSNDKARTGLIEELKGLLGTGTHPDALLKKMKEANKQWKDMEDHEKLAGDKYGVRNMELYTQFREVQKALFEPAQQFFEKRSEIWDKELEQLESEVQALHDVDLQATPDRDLARMVRSAINHLRNLDKIPPKKRGQCAAAIRAGTARIDAHLKESYAVAERRKQKLIEQAQELIELEDLDSAIEQAKALQKEWKSAGIVQQAQERKLWKAFRKANDAVFNRIKLQRDQVKAENKELLDQANQMINECETNISKDHGVDHILATINKFKDNWHALKIDNKGLINKANKLISDGENTIKALNNAESIKDLKIAQKYAEICQSVELGSIDKEQALDKWQKNETLSDQKLFKKLNKRLEKAGDKNPDFIDHASHILIATEYLTGVSTPDEYKEQRLAYQVDELSKRMSGEENITESTRARQLLKKWFCLSATDKDFVSDNKDRIEKAINSLFDLLVS